MPLFHRLCKRCWLGNAFLFGSTCLKSVSLMTWRFTVSRQALFGAHDTPSCFPEKLKPASLTQQDLEASALWRRKPLYREAQET